jgi:hypothetical protein
MHVNSDVGRKIMKNASPLRVHIIPVGDDEIDRIVRPAQEWRADKIYFLRFRGKDIFERVHDQAKQELLQEQVVKVEDIFEVECDYYDFTELVGTYARIMHDEEGLGNHVFINVSTGGKLNSIAGMMAAMLFGATPYFCKKDFETNSIPPEPVILDFPRFTIQKPGEDLVQFLVKIQEYMEEHHAIRVSKGECLEIVKKFDRAFFRSKKGSGDYNKLKFKYLDKLAHGNFIKVEDVPRGRIEITGEGRFATAIFAMYYGLR